MGSSNIDINFFNDYIVHQFLNVSDYSRECNIDGMSNLSNLVNNTSNVFVVDIGNNTILDILEYDANNIVGDISNIHNIYCNLSYITHFSNQNFSNSMECNFTIDEEGLLTINSDYILSMDSNSCNIIDSSTWGSSNDTYYDYYNRYKYFSNFENEIVLNDYNINTACGNQKTYYENNNKSDHLTTIHIEISKIVDNTSNKEKDLKSLRIYVTALKYYYYVILLVITHYVISKLTTEFSNYQPYIDIENKFKEKLKEKITELNNFNVDGNKLLKESIKTIDNSYKESVDKYKTKDIELNNILNTNNYNNIFLYITIVVLILICLGIIYINNHKASLKSQYAIMIIAFLILYYIVYTNMTVNITEPFDSQNNKELLNKLILKVIGYLESVKSDIDNQYIYSALEREKNKYDGFAKSTNSKLNSLELVLNDEFINAIKSKELVKFLVLFTAICIISYIVYTNTEDLTTTSIIFIILFVIILMIYFYNINLITRTKADNKYWNHQMVMK